MNHEQSYLFMTSLLKHFVNSDDYPMFKKLGISADDFPSAYRLQFLDFERIAKKNLTLAKIKYGATFGRLPEISEKLTMNMVANNYHANAKAVRCYEFLENIQRSPLDADRIAKEFLKAKTTSVNLYDLKSQIESVVLEIEEKRKSGSFEVIIPYWENLSKTVGGFNPGTVFIITAKTGVGKTALALNIATSALCEMNVIYFNMEMLVADIVKRIFMANGDLTRADLASGKLIDSRHSKVFTEWHSKTLGNDKSLLISDGRALSIDEITSTISKEN
jgi:replicative DNA helicase